MDSSDFIMDSSDSLVIMSTFALPYVNDLNPPSLPLLLKICHKHNY